MIRNISLSTADENRWLKAVLIKEVIYNFFLFNDGEKQWNLEHIVLCPGNTDCSSKKISMP